MKKKEKKKVFLFWKILYFQLAESFADKDKLDKLHHKIIIFKTFWFFFSEKKTPLWNALFELFYF